MKPLPRHTAAVCAVAVLIAALAVPSASAGADGERPRRVLMVHSFGSSAPPFTTHSTAFELEIKRQLGTAVELEQVSLENARYAQPDLEEAFAEFLAKRVAVWQPDLVVPIAAPAGRFVAKYRDRLFLDTPVLYSGLDRRTMPGDAFTNNAAFVGEQLDVKGLVDDMLQLDPATNNVVVIFGATPLERMWTAEFQKAFTSFTPRVKFTYVNDLSGGQILDLVSRLPPHSFVLLGLLVRDASGVTFNQDELLKRLHEASRAPVNGLFLHHVGQGVVGGRLCQTALTGTGAARVAARILRGEPASSMPPLVTPMSTPTYDWRELRRWEFDESRLPPGSVVLFREPTTWERYRWQIVTAVAVIATQAVLIFALFFQLRRRRVAEVARRHAESDAQKRLAELAHMSRVATLGELTATLAHEVSQPLTAISSNAAAGQRFLENPDLDRAEMRDTLADISADTQRASEVVHRLRAMLKRGKPPEFAAVDLNDVIRSVERLVRRDGVRHRVAVELRLAPGCPPAVGDRVQLEQVVMNLMLNAFAAMDHPQCRTRRLIVRTAAADDGRRVGAEFRDSGVGIAADVIDRLFEPFVTTKLDGLGMGLSICRSILDQHGGGLRAANDPAGGATFSMTLPAARASRPVPPALVSTPRIRT